MTFGEEELDRAPKLFWTPGSLILSLCKLGNCATHHAALICAANVVLKIIYQKKVLAGLILQGVLVRALLSQNFGENTSCLK